MQAEFPSKSLAFSVVAELAKKSDFPYQLLRRGPAELYRTTANESVGA
jgi:hypothetical protein